MTRHEINIYILKRRLTKGDHIIGNMLLVYLLNFHFQLRAICCLVYGMVAFSNIRDEFDCAKSTLQ